MLCMHACIRINVYSLQAGWQLNSNNRKNIPTTINTEANAYVGEFTCNSYKVILLQTYQNEEYYILVGFY